ncbi:MAG: tetratricopeptide repeat protein [Limisphaerales bacterium]
MLEKLKLYLYPVLVFLVIWFAYGFYRNYTSMPVAQVPVEETNAAVEQTNAVADTNTTIVTTNADGTTNIAAAQPTNQPSATNAASKKASRKQTKAATHATGGSVMGNLAAFIICAILLGLLIAYDVTQYMGNQAVDFLFNDNGEGQRDPEYEHAEQVWANGNHLEAIELMRDYLKKNPREQYVALRIAEIYEKDLKNPLAAVLEYEEVLKQKLSAEHWGKAAIHLCNIYAKLGKQDQMQALLHRIVAEYPQTSAAKKARQKLGLPEQDVAAETDAEETTASVAPSPTEDSEVAAKSNLPPGFRPKK